ncbi:MAG: sensor histidine kinase [Bacteroidetes bacterium]|nr:sensor histidine kinase [Bacteroidota bacterium]
MQNKNRRLFLVIGSLLFLSIPFMFSPHSLLHTQDVFHPHFLKEIFSYALVLIFFYINYNYLFSAYYLRKKYGLYALILFIAFLICTFLPVLLIFKKFIPDTSIDIHGPFMNSFFYDVNRSFFLFVSGAFASFSFCMSDHLKQVNKDRINAELSYLKAQMNPHFLFNTLNSIYSLAIVKSNLTPTAIVKLSGMMRYAISETADKFVPLQKEMNYIDSYIDLQKMRLGETAFVNYSFSGSVEGKVIAPLVLIPFIENAFKHGVNPEETSQIDIQISVSDTHLYLHVFNLKVPHRMDKESQSGIGLENGKHQLHYLYPKKHMLKIDNNNFSFTVNLNLDLI